MNSLCTVGKSDIRNVPSCSAGYYCESGSSTPTPERILADSPNGKIFGYCDVGEFCASGASAPSPCEIGTYNDLTHQSKCTSCPRGYVCRGGTNLPEECPVGSYCTLGVASSCGINLFNPTQYGYTSQEHCRPCTPGFTCDDPALSPEKCLAGVTCVLGISS